MLILEICTLISIIYVSHKVRIIERNTEIPIKNVNPNFIDLNLNDDSKRKTNSNSSWIDTVNS